MDKIEITEVVELHQDEFVSTFGESYFDSIDQATSHFEKHVGNDTLFILFLNSKIIGFLSFIKDYSYYANYLENICVIEKHRRDGFSHFLLRAYTDISREQKTKNTVALSSTHVDNTISQKMHESFGFKKISILKGLHYGKDEIFYGFDL